MQLQIINYKYEDKYLGKYHELIRDIYNKFPLFAEAKVKETAKVFNRENPFLQFGNWQNFLLLKKQRPISHISVILDKRLPLNIGLVGYFDSINEMKYARIIFNIAENFLSRNRKRIIRGPINFTTWQGVGNSYPEKCPPFFLEPFTRAYYKGLFESYGFNIAQSRISTIQYLTQTGFDKFEKEFKRLEKKGFIFEMINSKNKLSSTLPDIYYLATKTFSNTWSFVKITLKEFLYNFNDFSTLIDNHLLYVARNRDKKGVGFFWGVRDLYSKTESRVVLKTIGVLPEYQKLGVGRALFHLVYRNAKEQNISKFIFSTMRSDNVRIKELTAQAKNIYRKYAVYELSQ